MYPQNVPKARLKPPDVVGFPKPHSKKAIDVVFQSTIFLLIAPVRSHSINALFLLSRLLGLF
jgi:hypothetical protein